MGLLKTRVACLLAVHEHITGSFTRELSAVVIKNQFDIIKDLYRLFSHIDLAVLSLGKLEQEP